MFPETIYNIMLFYLILNIVLSGGSFAVWMDVSYEQGNGCIGYKYIGT